MFECRVMHYFYYGGTATHYRCILSPRRSCFNSAEALHTPRTLVRDIGHTCLGLEVDVFRHASMIAVSDCMQLHQAA